METLGGGDTIFICSLETFEDEVLEDTTFVCPLEPLGDRDTMCVCSLEVLVDTTFVCSLKALGN